MDISFNELKCKEVVNISDGRRLGRVIDLTFDYESLCVLGLCVPGGKGVNLFKCKTDLFIPMCHVVKIGDDVILVKLDDGGLRPPTPPRPPHPPCPPRAPKPSPRAGERERYQEGYDDE